MVKSKMRFQEVIISAEALLNSGATKNFMEPYLVDQLGLNRVKIPTAVILGNRTTTKSQDYKKSVGIFLSRQNIPTKFLVMKYLP